VGQDVVKMLEGALKQPAPREILAQATGEKGGGERGIETLGDLGGALVREGAGGALETLGGIGVQAERFAGRYMPTSPSAYLGTRLAGAVGRKLVETAPEYNPETGILGELARASGSTAAFVPFGLIGGPAGLVSIAGAGVLANGYASYEDSLRKYPGDEEKAWTRFWISAPGGAMEAATLGPISKRFGKIFARITRASGGKLNRSLLRTLGRTAAKEMPEEAFQEGFQEMSDILGEYLTEGEARTLKDALDKLRLDPGQAVSRIKDERKRIQKSALLGALAVGPFSMISVAAEGALAKGRTQAKIEAGLHLPPGVASRLEVLGQNPAEWRVLYGQVPEAGPDRPKVETMELEDGTQLIRVPLALAREPLAEDEQAAAPGALEEAGAEPAQGKTAPAAAVAPEQIEAEAKTIEDEGVRDFVGAQRKAGYTGTLDVVPAEDVEGSEKDLELAQDRGVRIDYVRGESALPLSASYRRDRIILDATADEGTRRASLLVHELAHHFRSVFLGRGEDPGRVSRLLEAIEAIEPGLLESAGEVYKELWEAAQGDPLDAEGYQDEATAYLVEQVPGALQRALEDPARLRQIAERNPGVIRQIVDWILEMASKLSRGRVMAPAVRRLQDAVGETPTGLEFELGAERAAKLGTLIADAFNALAGRGAGEAQALAPGTLVPALEPAVAGARVSGEQAEAQAAAEGVRGPAPQPTAAAPSAPPPSPGPAGAAAPTLPAAPAAPTGPLTGPQRRRAEKRSRKAQKRAGALRTRPAETGTVARADLAKAQELERATPKRPRRPEDRARREAGLSAAEAAVEAYERGEETRFALPEPRVPLEGETEQEYVAAELERQADEIRVGVEGYNRLLADRLARAAYRRARAQEPETRFAVAGEDISIPTQSQLQLIRQNVQDTMEPFLRAERATGEEAFKQARQRATLYGDRGADRWRRFREEHWEPLADHIRANWKGDERLEATQKYLYARHAPERNAVIEERTKGTKREKTEGSGMSNLVARYIVSGSEKSSKGAAYRELGRMWDEMMQAHLALAVDYGLIPQQYADHLSELYSHYIPLKTLMGENEQRALGIGRGADIRGKEFRIAMGRGSLADAPFAHGLAAVQRTVLRGEKNRAAFPMLELLREQDGEIPGFAKLREPRFVEDAIGPQSELVVGVKEDGVEHRIEFDPAYREFAGALHVLTAKQTDVVTRHVGKMTRFLSGMATRYNPVFPIFNAMRDIGGAFFTSAEHGLAFATRVVRDTPRAWAALIGIDKTSKWAKAITAYQAEGAKMVFAGVDDVEGHLRKVETDLSVMKDLKGSKMRSTLRRMGKVLAAYSDAVENAARLSSFVNAQEQLKLTAEDAAFYAKEITTNFRKKGLYGNTINAWWMFSNAGIQGTARVAAALKNRNVQKLVASAVFASALLDWINRIFSGLDDDDEPYYDAIPDYVKRNNVILPWPNGKRFITIPAPFVYNWFHTLGTNIGELSWSAFHPDDQVETLGGAIGDMAVAAVDSFNPLGGTDQPLSLLAPTLVDPIVDISTNIDFAGRQIARKPFPGQMLPRSEQHWPDVNPTVKAITDALNRWTGGDEFEAGGLSVNPEHLEHLAKFALSGLGATIGRTYNLADQLVRGEEIETRQIPLVRRVLRDPSPYALPSRYKEAVQDVRTAAKRVKSLRDQREYDAARAATKRDRPLIRLDQRVQVAERTIKSKKGKIEKARTPKLRRRLEQEIRDVQARINELVEEARQEIRNG